MMNNVYNMQYYEEEKYIEDIIDARKKNGEYNINSNCPKGPNVQGTARYAYSTPRGMLDDRNFIPDETMNIEGDLNDRDNNPISIGPTDSEITVVRVKRESSQLKELVNKWDMHDKAIPGDGRHLGESPSLVNLVTLVKSSKQSLHTTKSKEQLEYLVPLSSWEPANQQNESADLSLSSKVSSSDESIQSNRQLIAATDKEGICKTPANSKRLNFAGKLSVFFRRYLKKPKKPQE